MKTARKARGRPRVGSKLVGLRIPPDQLAALEAWCRRQPTPRPGVPEAIRRLVGIALACEARRKNQAAR
jgi:hypothetical protein